MRFPLSLTRAMTAYLLRQRIARRQRFPMVLMLEPLHACNLRCAGCGRIREYADTMDRRMSVAECLDSIDECGAPIVSICGGEPLIYPEIRELVDHALRRRKHIYLCTNGQLLEEKLELFRPSSRLMLNVHLDGAAMVHDAITCHDGAYAKAVAGIKAAKAAGFILYTNSTVYQQTTIRQLTEMFDEMTAIGVDGFMLSPAYGYQAVKEESGRPQSGSVCSSQAKSEGASAMPSEADTDIFMDRSQIIARFQEAEQQLKAYRLVTSPLYFDFLCGRRELPCAAWANPTRNVAGWRSPCYLIADTHYATYRKMVEATDWSRLGPTQLKPRWRKETSEAEASKDEACDARCRDCMVHCGFEPSAVLNHHGVRDLLRMAIWQFS